MQTRKSTIDLNFGEESKKHEKKSKNLNAKTNSKAILNRADTNNNNDGGESE